MKRFFLALLLMAFILPAATRGFWWTMPVILFVLPFVLKWLPGRAFLSGFILIAAFWTIGILFADIPNHHILSSRMAMLFNLPNYTVFLLVNILLGGLVGGLAAWSGALVRRAFPLKPVSS